MPVARPVHSISVVVTRTVVTVVRNARAGVGCFERASRCQSRETFLAEQPGFVRSLREGDGGLRNRPRLTGIQSLCSSDARWGIDAPFSLRVTSIRRARRRPALKQTPSRIPGFWRPIGLHPERDLIARTRFRRTSTKSISSKSNGWQARFCLPTNTVTPRHGSQPL